MDFAYAAGEKQAEVEDAKPVIGGEKHVAFDDVFTGQPDMLPEGGGLPDSDLPAFFLASSAMITAFMAGGRGSPVLTTAFARAGSPGGEVGLQSLLEIDRIAVHGGAREGRVGTRRYHGL